MTVEPLLQSKLGSDKFVNIFCVGWERIEECS